MLSIRKWLATKMSVQAANNSQSMRRRFMLDGSSSNSSRNFDDSPAHSRTLIRFYFADEELNMIAAELDSFDGRKDPLRCTTLVNQLRAAQDKVISLLFHLMDEWHCSRSERGYREKFPDDLLSGGENGESLNGQIWFGAECLAAGSNIMNHETESELLRPMAKTLTHSLDELRMQLRHTCSGIDESFFMSFHHKLINLELMLKMEEFDRLFSTFEYEYVKAMLPIKTADEIEKLHELTVLFSEAVSSALQRRLLLQEDIDDCQPHVMIAIPRLAIMYALTQCSESSIVQSKKEQVPEIFKPFHSVLSRLRELIAALRPVEIELLERMLTNEESVTSDLSQENCKRSDEQVSSPRERLATKHKRRHSAPDRVSLKSDRAVSQYGADSLSKCASTTTLATMISLLGTDLKETCLDPKVSKTKSHQRTAVSNVSLDSTNSVSSVDSFELALALRAKNSLFISSSTKQLLHRLFVTIAGTADQLQSNCAADLRLILRNIFAMYSDNDTDDASVEEAYEAHEDASTSSGSSSSSVSTPTATESRSFPTSLASIGMSPRNDERNIECSSSLPSSSRPDQCGLSAPTASSSTEFANDEASNPVKSSRRRHRATTKGTRNEPLEENASRTNALIAPIWVPDELVSSCTGCTQQFTLIRRRHHCRNCGQIYCQSCSSQSVPLAHFGFSKPVRVCSPCFTQFSESDSN
ncbi:Lateral signaling target protein 2 [Halotydeus destructor]|nr:Lateral signaling target protein 2 [Halotydeus destructor]